MRILLLLFVCFFLGSCEKQRIRKYCRQYTEYNMLPSNIVFDSTNLHYYPMIITLVNYIDSVYDASCYPTKGEYKSLCWEQFEDYYWNPLSRKYVGVSNVNGKFSYQIGDTLFIPAW